MECNNSKPPDVFVGDFPEKALRFNEGKPKWSLVHYKSVEPLVRVLEMGANKYARDNWKLSMTKTDILDSLQRHLACLMDGEQLDQESGLPHTGHIMANAMFYQYHNSLNSEKDIENDEK